MNWWLAALRKYAEFSGRARRKEYWFFVLFNWILAIIAVILDNLLGITIKDLFYGPLYLLLCVALLFPSWAVLVRRLHDIGKSGWFWFIGLIPLIGGIWLLVLLCRDSMAGENQYGPNPKM
ncbi:MAG: DUF805 domain-containing protein [Candidatus Eisenbacteria bacterium]|nr:DUF805 domain-containing protein [Candidatus Eisenbacteria bacterium]